MASAPRDENREPGLIAKSDADNTPVVIEADAATKRLKVSAVITGGGSSGTQYTDGDAAVTHPVGTIPVFNNAGTITAVSAANPLPVSATISTAGLATSTKQSDGSQKTQVVDGSGNVIGATSNALDINIKSGNPTTTVATQMTPSNLNAVVYGFDGAGNSALATESGGVLKESLRAINGVTVLAGNGVTGAGSQRVTVASDNTPFPVKTDQTSHGTTDLVASDVTKIAGTSIVNGGVAGSQSIGGTVATNVAITANPINLGAQAVSSENSAVTTARQVQLVADLVGKLIVLPYANPENFVSGTATATDTTSTSLVASPGGSLRNYITQFTVWNSSAVNTYIKIQDGSGGTTLYTLPCPTVGGSVITLPTPLRQPTTATAIFFAANASANAVFISASGYKGL